MLNSLKLIENINSAREYISECKSKNLKIGFVPTMGALHEGHISLINNAKNNCDIVVVSIFVNKKQFNDLHDFNNYPRIIDEDLKILQNSNVDMVFIPKNDEIYPTDFATQISLNNYTECLCGAYRKGHFDGVALILTKLFNIIQSDYAYFGEKDYQQLLIIKKLVEDLNFNIKIINVPTFRELSGLAMSSRNKRLSENGKKTAELIFKVLNDLKNDPKQIANKIDFLLKNGIEKVEYLEIRNESNLKLVNDFNSEEKKRIFIAVYVDGVRLIDNIQL